ncbi:Methylglyoxal synthase [Arsenophonus endosymbiont of Bemisia tabaci Q2]|nr:Methylglyoxal synthase [Arsenophonus endosymbiont of Bemisia tabaci Q2]
MESVIRRLEKSKNIALVAHDHRKLSLLTWLKKHISVLKIHKLFATGTTGNLIHQHTRLNIVNMLSGPMRGDQQLGAMIAEQKFDILIF